MKLSVNLEPINPIINRWKKANPLTCHFLGIHDYDGIFPSYNEDSINNRIEEIKQDLILVSEVRSKSNLDNFEIFEIKLVQLALEEELFELDEREEFKDNPITFINPLTTIERSYAVRSFATHKERIYLIIKFTNNIPIFLNTSFKILNKSMSKIKISISIQFLEGIINFYKGNQLKEFIKKCKMEEMYVLWEIANEKAIDCMELFLEALKNDYLLKGHDDFRLGKDKFMKLLEKQEFITISYEKLLKIAETDLESNFETLKKILGTKKDNYLSEMQKNYPDPEKLIEYTTETLERTKQFLIDSNIVTPPTDEQCKVMETPEYARKFVFAAMNVPGPFEREEASEAYYYITPPEKGLSEEKLNEHMSLFSKPVLEIITCHEVWPGHFLQLLYNKQSKSDISKLFARSTSLIEGYAHYTEEMVVDEGLDSFDKIDLRIAQLTEALIRNCRFYVSLKMHCEDMTLEEAKTTFMEKGFLSESNALIEARRGTIDPMYINYTLGKLMINKLRKDMKNIKGNKFNLKEFHNTILSYGSPPITALRELLLDDRELIKEIL